MAGLKVSPGRRPFAPARRPISSRVEAAPFLSGGAVPVSLTLTLPRGLVSMLATPKHVSPLEAGGLERGYAVGLEITQIGAEDRAAYQTFVDSLAGGSGGS